VIWLSSLALIKHGPSYDIGRTDYWDDEVRDLGVGLSLLRQEIMLMLPHAVARRGSVRIPATAGCPWGFHAA
jgi:hypothetical protein